ncbi:MAG: TfoX/Sxy family protein [Patescibacteria group bacterium]|mgnify:CR=1 FL=1
MHSSRGFHDYIVHDLCQHIAGITSRKMFGGYGIYKKGIIFAIIVDGKLFFKVGDTNKNDYESRGLKPFTYEGRGGKRYAMSYFEVPEDVLEQQELFSEWVEKAVRVNRENKKT